VEITAPQDVIGKVYQVMNSRRGIIESENNREGTPLSVIKAFMPVAESFGFVS